MLIAPCGGALSSTLCIGRRLVNPLPLFLAHREDRARRWQLRPDHMGIRAEGFGEKTWTGRREDCEVPPPCRAFRSVVQHAEQPTVFACNLSVYSC